MLPPDIIVTIITFWISTPIFTDSSYLLVQLEDYENRGNWKLKDEVNETKGSRKNQNETKSRIINQENESQNNYPWIAGIIKDFSTLEARVVKEGCTGSLINEKQILTAAHCLCWHDDIVDLMFDNSKPKSLPSLRCLPNIERTRSNGKKYTKYKDQIQDISETNFNKIYFVLGAKTLPEFTDGSKPGSSQNTWSPSLKAIVMSTEKEGTKVNLNKGYDVGILFIPSVKKITPISLPNKILDGEYDNEKAHVIGYGSKFAFGEHSKTGVPGTKNDPSKYSSCMTSEKGPSDGRFKYCNTKKIFYKGCVKGTHTHPEGPKKKEECAKYKVLAEFAIEDLEEEGKDENKNLGEEFERAHRIRVYKSKPQSKDDKPLSECTPMKWIKKDGWCEIASEGNKNQWGICSPSCQFLGENFQKGQDFEGSGYYELKVFMVEQDLSGNKLNTECGLKKSIIKNDAEMCAKTQPPQTEIWEFYIDADADEKLKFDKVVHERTGRSYGYRGAATGDSGAPIWFKNPTTSKNEVVGIVTSLNGNPKKIGTKPVNTEGVIVGTKINEKILKWINMNLLF